MQINIGDKVRFLNDIGGGIVTRIVDANTVMVLNEEDEFEIPTLKKNIVVVESASNGDNQQKSASQASASSTITASPQALHVEKEDIYVAFVPREGYEPTDSPLELYLINDTNQILLYNYYNEQQGDMHGVTAGNIDPKSKILLCEYDQKELNEMTSCHFQILYYQLGKFEVKRPLEKTLKIQPVKFHKSSSYKDTAYFHQEVILHKLTGENLADKLDELSKKEFKQVLRDKEGGKKAKTNKPNITPKDAILEIDLHINALIDSVTGLSNADILEIQLKEFHDTMRANQNNKGKRIVFIHGIGNGTLKKKVHDELRRKYKKHYQQDASFKEYGWGATMVTIR
jgi:hypothetical protein